MQPANGPRRRIACALVLAIVVAMTASSAIGRTGHAPVSRQPPPNSMAPAEFPCTPQSCAINPTTNVSRVNVVPIEVPAGGTPSFFRGSTPDSGMLHRDRNHGNLSCKGYRATDPDSVQFYLGGTFRGSVTYRVTDVVSNANPTKLQFCLGATFQFRTSSGNPASAVTLPNGLSGFAGLVPSCVTVPNGPCLFSKTQAGKDAVLRLLIPAVEGADPWGRS